MPDSGFPTAWMRRPVAGALLALALGLSWLAPVPAMAQTTRPAGEQPPTYRETLQEFQPTVLEVSDSQNISTAPSTVADLLALESRIRAVVEKVLPATVGLIITQGRNQHQGSGVIISPDGYVLTAAHVAGRPGNRVLVIMPDGTRYNGVSLGMNRSLDDGLIKVTDDDAASLPYAPLGSADALSPGTWTVALGHPGGYQRDRPPVVRVGRILSRGEEFVLTDNTLVGGDSGGPLFDLDGRVIGIHSRIEGGIVNNVHVPVDRFIDDWQTLVNSQETGGRVPAWMRQGTDAVDGLENGFDPRDIGDDGARVVRVPPQSPAAEAGIQVNDRIVAMDGRPVLNGQDIMLRRMGLRPEVEVTYTVRRGDQTLELKVTPVDRDDLRRPNFGRFGDPKRPVMGVVLDQTFPGPGVRLDDVREGGPAAVAGLKGGDILVSYDGQFLRHAGEMGELMAGSRVGDVIKLGVRRDGQLLEVELTLRTAEDVYPEQTRRPRE